MGQYHPYCESEKLRLLHVWGASLLNILEHDQLSTIIARLSPTLNLYVWLLLLIDLLSLPLVSASHMAPIPVVTSLSHHLDDHVSNHGDRNDPSLVVIALINGGVLVRQFGTPKVVVGVYYF